MSTSLVLKAIADFLTRKGPEVLCIRGKWGVGKTYTWNDVLNTARKTETVDYKNYSYVSLFGINSLAALKLAIFEGVVSLAGDKPLVADINSVQAFIESGSSQWRKLGQFISKLPIVSQFTGDDAIGSLSFLSVRNMLICIDDLERKGADLSLTDVLGLASELRERRGCKIVFLLNDEELGEDKSAFESYLEKVADISLLYEPTPAEAAEIAKGGTHPVSARTAELCVSLGIRNIRVIKKIDRHIADIAALLKGRMKGVFAQASATVALLGWAHYQPSEAPPLDYLKTYNSMALFKDPSPEQGAWNAQLAAYGYTATDDFDRELLEGIVRGYFDDKAIAEHANALEVKLKAVDADGSFESAWAMYHDSFDNNEKDAVDTIYASFMKNIPYISPLNLNGTVLLMKELEQEDKAKEIIAAYITGRSEERAFFDLEEYSFGSDVTDPDVRVAFAKKLADTKEERDIKAILLGLKDGWSEKNLNVLGALRPADYVKLFKEARGAELRRMISGCLQFASIHNASEAMRKIVSHARDALATIGAESKINERRVARYGVVPTPKAARPRVVRKPKQSGKGATAAKAAAPVAKTLRPRTPGQPR